MNGRADAEFEGELVRQAFEIGGRMKPGASNQISILFDAAPHGQGQVGFTSRSRHFKPRFACNWDWYPRLVPCGIGGGIDLVIEPCRWKSSPCALTWMMRARAGLLCGILMVLSTSGAGIGKMMTHFFARKRDSPAR